VAKNQGRPPANCQQGTKALCPATHKELNPANKHINELRSEASQLNLQKRWEALANTSKDLEPEDPAKLYPHS